MSSGGYGGTDRSKEKAASRSMDEGILRVIRAPVILVKYQATFVLYFLSGALI